MLVTGRAGMRPGQSSCGPFPIGLSVSALTGCETGAGRIMCRGGMHSVSSRKRYRFQPRMQDGTQCRGHGVGADRAARRMAIRSTERPF